MAKKIDKEKYRGKGLMSESLLDSLDGSLLEAKALRDSLISSLKGAILPDEIKVMCLKTAVILMICDNEDIPEEIAAKVRKHVPNNNPNKTPIDTIQGLIDPDDFKK